MVSGNGPCILSGVSVVVVENCVETLTGVVAETFGRSTAGSKLTKASPVAPALAESDVVGLAFLAGLGAIYTSIPT